VTKKFGRGVAVESRSNRADYLSLAIDPNRFESSVMVKVRERGC
jgi:hypothetical protein